jgi:hypothetical protein
VSGPRRAIFTAVGAALACGPIQAPSRSDAPMNACPEHPCSAYAQSGPAPLCNARQCLVASEFSNLVLVVSLPQDSPFASERTLSLPLDSFLVAPPPQGASCPTQRCAWLPGLAEITGIFQAIPSDATDVGWNLGNPGLTWLPAQATYRPVWTPPNGGSPVDATSLGLPAEAVSGNVIPAPGLGTIPPGPSGGTSMVSQVTNLPPGQYELTLTPVPPLDRAFPPDVEIVDVSAGVQRAQVNVALDKTRGTDPSGSLTYPTFDITRDDGLDGWSAYLRDATTLRRISNLVTLSGITVSGVQLFTDHHPPPVLPAAPDALTNAQLVVEPPQGQPIPTYVASVTGGLIPRNEQYSSLPPNLTVSGRVTAADGSPLEAELEFEATGIDEIRSGKVDLNTQNFVYGARTNAQLDATGASTYSIALPQGEYRVSIRPTDATAAVTIVPQPLPVDSAHPRTGIVFAANPPQIVQGVAAVADGRPLAGAMIDVLPVGCAAPPTSPSCMPRAAQTTTADDGSFAFGLGKGTPGLDQGSYVLRVRPADGTRLPWVFAPGGLLVGPTPVVEPLVAIPAPAYAGLRLYDPASNPVVNAVVRMFALQPQGPAIEVARAITDTNGDYDMYLAPTTVAQ